MASEDRDWANLFREILASIAKRLSSLDYCNFSCVCTSWASVVSPDYGMPPPIPLQRRQPFLWLPGEDGEQSECCMLVDFSDNCSIYRVDRLPEIRGKWCVGSQFGWLTVIDEFSNPSLLNPFTRAQIDLPPVTTLPKIDPVYDPKTGALSGYMYDPPDADDDDDYRVYTLEEFRGRFSIKKIALSSNPGQGVGLDAVAILGLGKELIFTRAGEGRWNLHRMWYPGRYEVMVIVDVIHHDDGKFLVLTNSGYVYAVDLSGPSFRCTLFADTYGQYCETRYLVADSSGVLLQIMMDQMANTRKIDVRSLDPETGTWIPLKALGDCSIFVGICYSVSISARESSGLKENHVYFTDDFWDGLILTKEMTRAIRVFNLSDDSFEDYFPPDRRLTWPPPIWVTSPLL